MPEHKNQNNLVHSGQSINDEYIQRNCGLLENFDKKLNNFYEDLQGKVKGLSGNLLFLTDFPWVPIGRESCLSELKIYQKDLLSNHQVALRMCNSWGEPNRFIGNPAKFAGSDGTTPVSKQFKRTEAHWGLDLA